MTPTGPDMDLVEETRQGPGGRAWCVPKYSNPDGIVYSEETIRRIANLNLPRRTSPSCGTTPTASIRFEGATMSNSPDILSLCREAGNPDMVYEFASTSKVTFPGAGISVMATSASQPEIHAEAARHQTISDKVNQQRHVLYLGTRPIRWS